MNDSERWLTLYETDRRHAANKALHYFCVPAAVIGLIGLLWSVPVPAAWQQSAGALNWGTVFLMATLVYYFILSFSLAIGILPFVVAVVGIVAWMDSLPAPLWLPSGTLLLLALAGQSLGHWIERRRTCVVKDLQYLMIGPLWLLASFFRRVRIPY